LMVACYQKEAYHYRGAQEVTDTDALTLLPLPVSPMIGGMIYFLILPAAADFKNNRLAVNAGASVNARVTDAILRPVPCRAEGSWRLCVNMLYCNQEEG
jgi:hypothetical protein